MVFVNDAIGTMAGRHRQANKIDDTGTCVCKLNYIPVVYAPPVIEFYGIATHIEAKQPFE